MHRLQRSSNPRQGPGRAPLGAHLEDGLLHEPRQDGIGAQGGHAAVLAQNPVRQRYMPYIQSWGLKCSGGCRWDVHHTTEAIRAYWQSPGPLLVTTVYTPRNTALLPHCLPMTPRALRCLHLACFSSLNFNSSGWMILPLFFFRRGPAATPPSPSSGCCPCWPSPSPWPSAAPSSCGKARGRRENHDRCYHLSAEVRRRPCQCAPDRPQPGTSFHACPSGSKLSTRSRPDTQSHPFLAIPALKLWGQGRQGWRDPPVSYCVPSWHQGFGAGDVALSVHLVVIACRSSVRDATVARGWRVGSGWGQARERLSVAHLGWPARLPRAELPQRTLRLGCETVCT